MSNNYEEIEKQYKEQKRQATQHGQLSQEQKVKQELRQLPQGEELFTWIAGHLQKRLDRVPQVLWKYADQNPAQQKRSQLITFLNGQTNEVLVTTEVSRQEIAQMRSTGTSWINQLAAQIQDSGEQEHQSEMHERFEDQMSDQFEEMMKKITGGNE